jgi:DNA polymerase-3 subunit alpha
VHSEYSLLDGACRVDSLCKKTANEGAPGIALTDHGVMFGAVNFYDSAKKHGLTPIIGCEAYIAPRGRFDRTVRDEAHITLLAADDVGYKNLTTLISKGFLEGYYYKPRIDMDLLAKHHEGLIVLSGCMSSLVAAPLLKNDYEGSKKNAKMFHDIFGDRFYMEIMRHGMPEEDAINNGLIKIARELNYPIVATNDSHYLTQGDAPAHDVLLCIGTGKTVSDTSRMKFFSDQFYVKSAEEMRELFADIPEACDTTLEIVKRIDITIPEKVFYLPDYPVPRVPRPAAPEYVLPANVSAPAQVSALVGSALFAPAESSLAEAEGRLGEPEGSLAFALEHDVADDAAVADGASDPGVGVADDGTYQPTADEYLRGVCEEGLIERYGAERAKTDAALRERLEYELGVIITMGFSSYFLIVWDFIKYARDQDIPVGPGRGSAVGSLVSYCLAITDLDPIKHNLLFERFLNPERISMPDIDTDFCVERRDEVIRYVVDKYGKDRVAQIVTFGTMAARAAVRDAGRALGVPLMDVDRVAKLIPSGPTGLTIPQALEQIPELGQLYAREPQIRTLLDTAKSIEGLARNASTHAAGVVISKHPLTDHVPLVRIGDNGVNTQYEMSDVERIGLLKMDFLGLRNLTVMKAASDEIRRTVRPDFDLAKIADDDKKTYDMLSRAETLGVFQLESEGMKRVCIDLKPSRLEDVIALVALYRPGPMEWIPQYIAVKHGRSKPVYIHPKLEAILGDTHGIAMYQESIMQIVRDCAGFSMGQADELRKVVGKKQKDKIPVYKAKFIAGCAENGIGAKLAEDIFAFIEPFAGYGFNKAHATAYGWIAYQTGYLKANYPLQYFAALMSSVRDKTDKLVEYIDEAKKMGIAVLPPDVNASLVDFSVVGDQIRFGLAAVKGIGENAVRAILDERERSGPFVDLFDLAQRVGVKAANRKVYEALIKCGALDLLPGNRAQLLDALDAALEVAAREARDREMGQASLFGLVEDPHPALKPSLRPLPAPSTMEQLGWEKETLGIFVSGHPLADVAEALARTGAVSVRDLRNAEDDSQVKIAGLITAVRRTMTKAQSQMLIATVEDTTGAIECVVFPKQYGDLQGRFIEDQIVVITGRLRLRERRGAQASDDIPPDLNVSVNDVQPFDRNSVRHAPPPPAGWHVTVTSREQIDDLALMMSEWSGTTPLVLHINGSTIRRTVAADRRVRDRLIAICGEDYVREGAP